MVNARHTLASVCYTHIAFYAIAEDVFKALDRMGGMSRKVLKYKRHVCPSSYKQKRKVK